MSGGFLPPLPVAWGFHWSGYTPIGRAAYQVRRIVRASLKNGGFPDGHVMIASELTGKFFRSTVIMVAAPRGVSVPVSSQANAVAVIEALPVAGLSDDDFWSLLRGMGLETIAKEDAAEIARIEQSQLSPIRSS